MADGTGSDRIVNSVASIATRLRDVETVKATKPNTTPPGNTSGTLTLLDTPVTVLDLNNVDEFTWATVNVYQSLPAGIKAIWANIISSRSSGIGTSPGLMEIRRDNLGISPVYHALDVYTNQVNTRMFIPISQAGTFEIQITDSSVKFYDIDIIAEGFLA